MMNNARTLMSERGRHGRQKGQALVIFGLLFVFLIGIVGMATDGAVAYAYSVSMERAASAAALAGAPYMPNYLTTATTRAKDESKRNGWVDGTGTTTVVVSPAGSRQLDVKVSTVVPTFFMAALGIQPYRLTREAVAGYLPPIPLGQPGNQLASTGAQLGAGSNFYLLRMKAENKFRSEGDPYGTQSTEGQAPNSTDVHNISTTQGAEISKVGDCSTTNAAWKLPCKGGQNFRVSIPTGTSGELQVYNAAFAPDFNTNNKCDNLLNLPTCGSFSMREGTDDGMAGNDPNGSSPPSPAKLGEPLGNGHCGNTIGVDCTSGAGGTANRARYRLYNAVAYTLMAVPNIFVRTDDLPIMQTRILPIDATNYDGDKGNTGAGSTKVPTYTNVTDGKGFDVTQTYGISGCATCPNNMRVYHSWDNIVTEDGTTNGDNRDSNGVNVVKSYVTDSTNYPLYVNSNGSLKAGTYRLRVDLINANGVCCATSPEGDASKAYALRVVNAGVLPTAASAGNQCSAGSPAVNCEIAGWEDMTIYSPISGTGGSIPLFNLPKEYAGQTINVDAYDVGDAPGTVNLSLTDPKTNAMAACGSGSVALPAAVSQAAVLPVNSCQQYTGSPSAAAQLNIYNQGNDRFSATPHQHIGPQFPSGSAPGAPDNRITHNPFTQTQAGEQSTTGGTGNYNGEWIRFEIPIDPSYDGSCPSSPLGGCFWQLNYSLTAGANDTFSFAVSTKGGPLHLITS